MNIGDKVRVIDDEYEEMIGLEGNIVDFSHDGTAAIVQFGIQVWCSVSNLEEVDDEDDVFSLVKSANDRWIGI